MSGPGSRLGANCGERLARSNFSVLPRIRSHDGKSLIHRIVRPEPRADYLSATLSTDEAALIIIIKEE